MYPPFLVLCLPRSRSAWLAQLLSYKEFRCHHEQAVTWRSIEHAVRFLRQPNIGVAETGISPGWRLLRYHLPQARIVVVRRHYLASVEATLRMGAHAGVAYNADILRANYKRMAAALDELAMQPGVLIVDHADLDDEQAIKAIWERCLPYDFDHAVYRGMKSINVQADLRAHIAYYHQNIDGITRFKAEAKRELYRLAKAGLIRRRELVEA